ncbi:MAG: HAMP domain-containing histidine kinase [Cyclobacteriaceae bacterium]|jgi:two-component system phosphate regulon sensor histidine kinase PhoR|nr:HAMP domain-containing histidine kinase [Cyclobacteriaceae bacterium]
MNPTQRIALILTAVFLIPALFFSVYEISSLTQDEKMIGDIYEKQLESILFSVNQYSDDIINDWMSKTQVSLDSDPAAEENTGLQNLAALNESLRLIFYTDTLGQSPRLAIHSLDSGLAARLRPAIAHTLALHQPQLNQLVRYKKSGFQKNEVLASPDTALRHYHVVCFISENANATLRTAGFVVEPSAFVEDLVGPKLQKIAKDQFVLAVYEKDNAAPVYSTLSGDTVTSAMLTKDFWVFPGYTLGIRTQGASLQHLVRQRTQNNLMLLIGLDVILVVAVVLAFRSVKKEVQLAQNKADFVANVSHEIRTPLALISMFAETLEMGRAKSEEKKQEYYAIIRQETHRLTGIVNKILNFSQTEAGKKTLHLQPVDLAHEIKDVLRVYDFHLKSKGFVYDAQDIPPTRVLADKDAVVEIIVNLLDNAIKYSPEEKTIELRTGQSATEGWLAVRDHGVGIARTDQKHIFDKFYRVPTGNLAKSRGTGLGLSLVRQLLTQQKGRIAVESDLGAGSTFTIFLPLAPNNTV